MGHFKQSLYNWVVFITPPKNISFKSTPTVQLVRHETPVAVAIEVTSTKPGHLAIAPYLDVKSVVEAAKFFGFPKLGWWNSKDLEWLPGTLQPPKINSWNLKMMEVWFRWFSSGKRCYTSGLLFIFRGVHDNWRL